MNILIIGNCQVFPISYYLNLYFDKKYNIISKNIIVHMSEYSKDINDIIINSDIIISQHLYNSNRYYNDDIIIGLVNDKNKIIYIHSLYFDGYYPDNNNFYNFNKLKVNLAKYETPYLEYLIYNNYSNEKIIEELNIFFYEEKVIKNLNNTLDELYNRENGLKEYKKIDVKIFDYIKDNYKSIYLFNTSNHPKNYLLNYYSYCIFEYINLKLNLNKEKKFELFYNIFEFLGGYTCPIYKNIYNILNLTFEYNGSKIVGNNNYININEYIEEIKKNKIL